MALARTREALHNGWDKNDPKDAQVILHMLRIDATQRYHDPLVAGINDIQELSKTHEAISRAKTEILHRILTHYVPLYFPEIERFRQNSRNDWFFALLDRFRTPASVLALGKDAFIAAAWDVVGRKVSKARLLGDIYETARSSIAPSPRHSSNRTRRIGPSPFCMSSRERARLAPAERSRSPRNVVTRLPARRDARPNPLTGTALG